MFAHVVKIVPLVIIACHLVRCQSGSNILVNIQDLGVVRGSTGYTARTNQSFASFYNIPYAEPPTGARRFKAPVRISPWSAVRDVTQPGIECPQPADGHNQNIEDCLSLSVFSKNTAGSFPVMVYVHGGGFYLGSAAEYPPHYLLERDIVLVVIQYRLGPFGFLSTLSETIPGNAGMLDIIMAVEWVRNHIADFGGNPQRITLFGQSAGAAAISGLLYSPLVPTNLFDQVILQSGGSMANWAVVPNPVENAKNIAKLVGCDVDAPLTAIEQCLMEASTHSLVGATLPHVYNIFIDGMEDISGMGMVVGGPSGFLERTPYQNARQGAMRRDVRMMGGVTKQDGSFLLNSFYDHLVASGRVNDSMYVQFELIDTMNRIMQLDENSGALLAFEIDTLFSESDLYSGNFTRMAKGLIDIAGAIALKGPVLRDIQANVRISEKETYLYTFDYAGEHTRFGYGKDTSRYPYSGGVHHSDENIYLFPFPEEMANLNEADTEMSEIMLDLWTSFASNGVPFSNNTPPWQPVESLFGPYMHIDAPASIGQNFYRELSTTVRSNAFSNLGKFALIVCSSLTVILLRV